MEVITKNYQETQKLGSEFAKILKGGEIIALVGELGSGKTTFVQGLAQGLGIKRRIISPTFIIVRHYKLKIKRTLRVQKPKLENFYHIDLYRLENNLENEIKNLGLTDVWGKKENIVVIEWAEKIKDLLPEDTVWVNFDMVDVEKRRISHINI